MEKPDLCGWELIAKQHYWKGVTVGAGTMMLIYAVVNLKGMLDVLGS